ncbi:MAG: methylated-DNA--[protein]-cysteine S-methyltransferase [Spirochaetia bacterium]|nr:methylated-DNA--[protein]-cysteine S-methyltransferase [Spirochaetia bacterium]
MTTTYYAPMESPVGELLIASNRTHILGVSMAQQKHGIEIGGDWEENPSLGPITLARTQLQEYFSGKRTQFNVPMAFQGTVFQERVWEELSKIPFGITISYGELARRIGRPKASRAVGLANGQNPIAIIVPCHRVIGADGSLTGYGGGLARKQQLLEWESRQLRMEAM